MAGLWSFCFITRKFYQSDAPPEEDYATVGIVLVARTLLAAWAEISPIGALVSVSPLWLVFLAQPHANLVFQCRVFYSGVFCVWLAYVVYLNNREMFITQVLVSLLELLSCLLLPSLLLLTLSLCLVVFPYLSLPVALC